MSASPVHSPIQRLDFDVLSCIFKINADMFDSDDHRALETTLATSRVCRDWRNFILGITSIWAHLLDIDHPLWRTVEGRRELICRSNGTALLWIKTAGCITSLRDHCPIFRCPGNSLNIVGENWERIQKLEVGIKFDHMKQWSSLLYLPAPHLKSFSITFMHNYYKINSIFSSLFGGKAPMLRELRFSGHISNFLGRPSWLHQLHSLDLSVKLTVSETLGVLMLTGNLVNLRLDRTVADYTTSTPPLISLPKLAHLDLNPFKFANITVVPVLLDHMFIPHACSLTISVCSILREEIDKRSTFAPIIKAISTCARPRFTNHVPKRLALTISPRDFILETGTHSDEPTFRYTMELAAQHTFSEHTLTILLSEFTLPSFSKVTSFDFKIAGVKRPVPAFTAFMGCLPSVNAIMTDKQSLRHLRAHSVLKGADEPPSIGLPAVEILELSTILPSGSDSSQSNSAPDPISKYVMARIAHGHAISIIDLTRDTLDALPDMAFLKKAHGLKVRWRQRGVAEVREYICGAGTPRNPVSV